MFLDMSGLKVLAEQSNSARDRLLEAIFTRSDVPQEIKDYAANFCDALNRYADENDKAIKILEERESKYSDSSN